MIKVEGVTVSYDRKQVIKNIYLELEPGLVYGVVGPNGAGKSTLFKAILGLVDLDSGRVLLEDRPVSSQRARLVYVPQKNDVDWTFPATVFDVVLMGRYPHKKILQRISAVDKEIAHAALQKVGMTDFAERQIGELSGGQQQRVFLARALCQEADYFLLDEPFVGVDITTEERIIRILKTLATEGKTILVVHHDLSTVRDYFDAVILLNQRLVTYGPVDTTFTDENVSRTYSSKSTISDRTDMLDLQRRR